MKWALNLTLGEFNMTNEKKKFTFNVQQIAVLGVLIAANLALSRVEIFIGPTTRISFGFIINAIIAILYGPWVAGFSSAGGDLLKSFIFGVQGQFFIGFTLTAFVGSFIYGVFLHRKDIKWFHILSAVVLNAVITNLVMNTFWLNLLYQMPLSVMLATRIPQNIIMTPIRFALIYIVAKNKQVQKIFEKYGTINK